MTFQHTLLRTICLFNECVLLDLNTSCMVTAQSLIITTFPHSGLNPHTFLLSLQQVHIAVLSCNAWPLWRLYLLCAAVSTFPDRLYELGLIMGSGQELHVPVICNKGSAEVSQQRLAWLQQLDLRRKTLGSSTVNKDSMMGRTLLWLLCTLWVGTVR